MDNPKNKIFCNSFAESNPRRKSKFKKSNIWRHKLWLKNAKMKRTSTFAYNLEYKLIGGPEDKKSQSLDV